MTAATALARERIQARWRALARPAVADVAFIVLAVGLSLAPYVFRLGFYSDDWVFLSILRSAPDQSVRGLAEALYAGDAVIRQRPAQVVYLAVTYRLFGLNPAGYHLANGLMLAATSALLYLSARALSVSRLAAIAVTLVYALLPHYATDRFWVAAHQATLSMLFYALSLYADVRALPAQREAHAAWRALGLASLVLSGLAYEVALPLFLLNPLLARLAAHRPTRARVAGLLAGNLAALAAVVVFKAVSTVRVGAGPELAAHLQAMVTGAVRVNFGTYGLGLPYVVGWILFHRPDAQLVGLAAAVGAGVYVFLRRLTATVGDAPASPRRWALLAGLGLVVFALGHAVLAASGDVWFTSASLGNRIAIAAALGVAMTFVGGLGWSAALLPVRARQACFCAGVALLCASGLLIVNTLAAFWAAAYQQQQQLVRDLHANVPALPSHSTLILDGVCLEHGGAYAFTGKRDLGSLLRMGYGDNTLWATAITNSPRLDPAGLSVLTFRDWETYVYGPRLYVYNAADRSLHTLVNLAAAQRYFEHSQFVPERDCPPGFAWGWNTR